MQVKSTACIPGVGCVILCRLYIYGTSSSTCLIIFLKVISKVLFFNITQKFTNLLVQLSIFLID
jgi:hypothetical protein